MSEKPLVSVVSTLYNYRDYVGDMISSVLNQTHDNWELIIYDDASTDNPQEVIEPFIEAEKVRGTNRIKYFRGEENRGYSYGKNFGITRTAGRYIVMIDADDFLTSNGIADRLEYLQGHPDRLWCHGKVYGYHNGQLDPKDGERRASLIRNKHEQDRIKLINGYHWRFIHAQSIMVTREFHMKLGLYDRSLPFSSDNEMFRRALHAGVIPGFVDSFVSAYRVHGEQMHKSKYKKKCGQVIRKKIEEDTRRRVEEGITADNTELWNSETYGFDEHGDV
jgi:glycosyltransferase involved in cell wall biosynthesis